MSGLKNPSEGGSTFLPYLLLLLFVLLNSMPSNVKALAQLELGLYFIPLFFYWSDSRERCDAGIRRAFWSSERYSQ